MADEKTDATEGALDAVNRKPGDAPDDSAGNEAAREEMPVTVSDLREAVDQKLDDLFAGLDDDVTDDKADSGAAPVAAAPPSAVAPSPAADRTEPAAVAEPAKAPAPASKPPSTAPVESAAVEPRRAPATTPPPKVPSAAPKTAATPPPKAPAPAAAPLQKTDEKAAAEQSTTGNPRPEKVPPLKEKTPVPVPSPPARPPKTPSQLGRIFLWGAVLGVIVWTVLYFKSYEFKAPLPTSAENGLLFHKITPPMPPPFGQKSTPSTATAPPAAAAVQVPTGKKPAAPAKTPPVAVTPYAEESYPWAIHMASYRDPDIAREKAAEYYRGFQTFLVYTDLGDKGEWYRLYFGHFPTATSAVDAIKKYGLKDTVAGHTRYACLMGSYASWEDARATTERLNAKGFFPYPITLNGTHHLLVGAHPTLDGTQVVSRKLSEAGFANRVIKR